MFIVEDIENFFATDNFNSEGKVDNVSDCWNFNDIKTHILSDLQRNILLLFHLLCIINDYFLMIVIITRKSKTDFFKRQMKNLFLNHNLKKQD